MYGKLLSLIFAIYFISFSVECFGASFSTGHSELNPNNLPKMKVNGTATINTLVVTGTTTITGVISGGSAVYSGTVTANKFVGEGSAITSLNATQLKSGSVPAARIAAGTITSTMILDDTIASSDVGAGQIKNAHLTGGSYTGITTVGTLSGLTVTPGTINGVTGAFSGIVTASRVISTVVQGTAPMGVTSTTNVSNLNVDYLDGQHGAYYQNASNLNAGSVPAARIAEGMITSTMILDNTVASSDVGASQIKSAHIVDSTIVAGDIADNTITSSDIGASQIKSEHILANTIVAGDIANDTITSINIGNGQIKTGHILDGTILTADIAASQITTSLILDNTIASSDISVSSIKTGHILDGTITGTDIAANTVASGNIGLSAVKTNHIIDGTILNADLANDTIQSAKIRDNTIVSADISAGAIKNAHLTAGSYTNITGLGTLSTLSMTGRLTCGEMYATSAVGLKLFDDGGNGLTIADGGNATFSGGLNVGSATGASTGQIKTSDHIFINAAAARLYLTSTTGTNYNAVTFTNTGGNLYMGMEGTPGASLLPNSTAYAGIINHAGNYPIQFGTNNAIRMTITSDGNVGIGTTNPGAKLEIYTNSTADTVLINRAANDDNGFIKLQTGVDYDWVLGLRNLSDSDFHLYSYGTSSDVLKIARDTGHTTLSGGLNVGSATGAGTGQIFAFTGSNFQSATVGNSASIHFGKTDGTDGWSVGRGITDHTNVFRVYDNVNGAVKLEINPAAGGSINVLGGLNVGSTTGAGVGDIFTSDAIGVDTNTPQGILGVSGNVYVTGNIFELYRGSGEIGCSYNVTAMNLVQDIYMDVTKNMITNPDSALIGMTHSNGIITISTNYGGRYKVEAAMTIAKTAAADDLHIGISKNDQVPLGIHEANLSANTTADSPLSVQAILTLVAGDTVRLKIENTTNSNDCTVTYCSLILSEL